MLPGPDQNKPAPDHTKPLILVVEDDSNLRAALRDVLELNHMAVQDYSSAEDFLAASHPTRKACLLLDVDLPGAIGGLDLLRRLQKTECYIPTIFITGSCSVKMALECMKLGALDLVQKPIRGHDLVGRIMEAVGQKCWCCELFDACHGATERVAKLTARQRQIMELMMEGHSGKAISADLGINQRTVEKHRADILKKLGGKSILALTQLSLAVSGTGFCGDPIPGRRNLV